MNIKVCLKNNTVVTGKLLGDTEESLLVEGLDLSKEKQATGYNHIIVKKEDITDYTFPIKTINNWHIEITSDSSYYPKQLKVYHDRIGTTYMNRFKKWDNIFIAPTTVMDWCEDYGYRYLLDTIAVCGISNNLAIEIVEILDYDDKISYKDIDGKIKTVTLYENTKGQYFNFGKMRIYLNECMFTGGAF